MANFSFNDGTSMRKCENCGNIIYGYQRNYSKYCDKHCAYDAKVDKRRIKDQEKIKKDN